MKGPNPALIVDLSVAAWRTQVLFATMELGLYDAIDEAGDEGADIEALVASTGAPLRSLLLLLNASAGLGLLHKREDGRFENTEASAAYLVSNKPSYWGGILGYARDAYQQWTHLGHAVRNDAEAQQAQGYLGEDPGRTRQYVLAMWNNAMGMGRAVTGAMDFSGSQHLLDLGGGPGAYASLLCQRFPELRVTVLELPAVAEIGREQVQQLGLSERVQFADGDYLEAIPELGQDAIMLSGTLHRQPAGRCAEIVKRAVATIPAGGRAVLNDVMLDGDGTRPVFSALFALNMLLTAPGGGAHTIALHEQWLRDAGCDAIDHSSLPPPVPYTIVTGRKL